MPESIAQIFPNMIEALSVKHYNYSIYLRLNTFYPLKTKVQCFAKAPMKDLSLIFLTFKTIFLMTRAQPLRYKFIRSVKILVVSRQSNQFAKHLVTAIFHVFAKHIHLLLYLLGRHLFEKSFNFINRLLKFI